MSDNSLFSFGSDGQDSLASEDVFRNSNGAGFGDARQQLPSLNSYFNNGDVFSQLQVPHQPQGPTGPHQSQGPPGPHHQGASGAPHHAGPPGMRASMAGYAGGGMAGMNNIQRTERQGPLTPPGSPDDMDPRSQNMDGGLVDVKPNVNGMVAALAGAGVTDPSIAPHIARALTHQSRARGPRLSRKIIDDDSKDDRYFERRKRNNAAAKKSRDTRKKREDEIAIRASFLEKENAILRAQVATLREEANSLRQMLLQKRSRP